MYATHLVHSSSSPPSPHHGVSSSRAAVDGAKRLESHLLWPALLEMVAVDAAAATAAPAARPRRHFCLPPIVEAFHAPPHFGGGRAVTGRREDLFFQEGEFVI